MEEIICLQCKMIVKAYPSERRKFCSIGCGTTYRNLHNHPLKSEASRKKLSESCKGRPAWNKGLTKEDPRVEKYASKIRKENNGMWKGGSIPRTYRYRGWKELRESILERDNHTCQECGDTKRILHVHHIIPWREAQNNEKSNLLTLCNKCHKD